MPAYLLGRETPPDAGLCEPAGSAAWPRCAAPACRCHLTAACRPASSLSCHCCRCRRHGLVRWLYPAGHAACMRCICCCSGTGCWRRRCWTCCCRPRIRPAISVAAARARCARKAAAGRRGPAAWSMYLAVPLEPVGWQAQSLRLGSAVLLVLRAPGRCHRLLLAAGQCRPGRRLPGRWRAAGAWRRWNGHGNCGNRSRTRAAEQFRLRKYNGLGANFQPVTGVHSAGMPGFRQAGSPRLADERGHW